MPQSARDPIWCSVWRRQPVVPRSRRLTALVDSITPMPAETKRRSWPSTAWEVLGDRERRAEHDRHRAVSSHQATVRSAAAGRAARKATAESARGDEALLVWLQTVYAPIDRLLGQVINPFPAEFKALSADPYDDQLMEAFCAYIEQSQV